MTSSSLQNSREPSGLLYRFLFSLGAFLTRLSNPLQQSNTANNPKDNTSENANVRINPGSSPIRVVIDSVPPPIPPSDEKKSEENKEKKRKTVKFWAELVIGFFIVLYTIVSIGLWCAARKANQLVEEDKRPYLWPAQMVPDGSIPASLTQKMQIKVQIANYGTSPALTERAFGDILLGPTALVDADVWFTKMDNLPEAERVTFPTFIQPNSTEPPIFSVIESQRPVVQSDLDAARMPNGIFYALVLRIYYTDVRSTLHYSDVCQYWTKQVGVDPHQLTSCQKHNQAH